MFWKASVPMCVLVVCFQVISSATIGLLTISGSSEDKRTSSLVRFVILKWKNNKESCLVCLADSLNIVRKVHDKSDCGRIGCTKLVTKSGTSQVNQSINHAISQLDRRTSYSGQLCLHWLISKTIEMIKIINSNEIDYICAPRKAIDCGQLD